MSEVFGKKTTGRELALGKDPRIQLISVQRTLSCETSKSKDNDKKVSAMHDGPLENSHVAYYRKALANSPHMMKHKKWKEAEKENLRKGIRQQFQELALHFSMEQFSGPEGSSSGLNCLDAVTASIKDLEITPKMCREFLPKINWNQLASLYVTGRTGAECESQWLNSEDPLINHSEWPAKEEKKLLFILQEKRMTNWFDIAVSLGTNRTPFQCLTHFQRSLNARILKSDWTEEEDAQLLIAVKTFGENDWQSVASALVGRTGPQCSNRWKKARRLGKWTVDQSKRLMVAVMLLGPSNWRKIAQFVPGQIDVNCRERWRNCIDPSLNFNKWTEEEDLRLKVAFQEYGNCWAKIAKCLAPRTNRQCLRRWKELFPDEVPLLQAARRIKKAAIISNFVDREVHRPALGPHDFVPLPVTGSLPEPENMKQSRKCKRKSRERAASREDNTASPRNTSKRRGSKRRNVGAQISNEEAPGITNSNEEASGITNGTEAGYKYGKTKKGTKTRLRKNSLVEQAQDDLTLNCVSVPVTVTDGTDVDVRKNGELCKSQPRRAESILEEIDGNSQNCSMFHPESSELRMIDYDGIGTIDSNNLALSQKICSKSGDEEQFLTTGFADVSMSSLDWSNSNLLEITNGHQDETVGQPGTSSQVSTLKLSSESSELRVVNIEDVDKSPLDGASTKNTRKALNCTSRTNIDSLRDTENDALDSNDDDNVTLACFRKNRLKKRRVLDSNDEDNITLTNLVCKSRKKSRFVAK